MKFARRSADGFTLIELMIVIAIVAVLAAILLGVISRVREQGHSAVCRSNLHQIGLAMQMYTDDHSGLFPLSGDGKLDGILFWPDNISPYLNSKQVLECPTLRADWKWEAPMLQNYFVNVYRLNYSPSEEQQNAGIGWLPRRESSVPGAARVWMVREERTRPYQEQQSGCGDIIFGWPVHHNGGGNYAFVDGHVKWLTPTQISALECSLPRVNQFSPE